MNLEKNYFTENEQRIKKAEQAITSQDNSEKYYNAMLAKIKKQKKNIPIPDAEIMEQFEKFENIAYLAETMAETVFLDVLIQTEKNIGKISLKGNGFIFPNVIDHSAKNIFALLLTKADDIAIYNHQGYLVAQFIFNFCN